MPAASPLLSASLTDGPRRLPRAGVARPLPVFVRGAAPAPAQRSEAVPSPGRDRRRMHLLCAPLGHVHLCLRGQPQIVGACLRLCMRCTRRRAGPSRGARLLQPGPRCRQSRRCEADPSMRNSPKHANQNCPNRAHVARDHLVNLIGSRLPTKCTQYGMWQVPR